MIEQKYRSVLFAITIFLLAITTFGLGFFAGTSIIIPENIEIDFDRENKLESFSNSMENFTKNIGNNTCNYNVTIEDDFYNSMLNSFERLQKERMENVKIINTFCKKPNSIGTLHIANPRELYYIELNKPIEVYDHIFEIIGASDELENIIIDINGAKKTLIEGDCLTNGKVQICAETIFVTTIPLLDAMGEFEIKELN